MKPEILTHPNIPKPLHGLNPRSIKGADWWDKTRFSAQERTGHTCSACGVKKSEAIKHKWLEGHEFWDINHSTGRCEVVSIEPLCHYCHNFIHSGRLRSVIGVTKSRQEVIDILEHGFKVLSDSGLKCFPGTLAFAIELGCKTFNVEPYEIKANNKLRWNDYIMVLEGKEYHSKFNDINEWAKFYHR